MKGEDFFFDLWVKGEDDKVEYDNRERWQKWCSYDFGGEEIVSNYIWTQFGKRNFVYIYK